jgi:hypothetical protein
MNKLLLTACAAAAVSAGTAAPGNAQPVAFMHDPIRVVRITPNPGYTEALFNWSDVAERVSTPGYSTISFVNEANVSVVRVAFAVTSKSSTQIVVENGTFSPGVTITHDIDDVDPDATISVEKVTLADGSVWNHA